MHAADRWAKVVSDAFAHQVELCLRARLPVFCRIARDERCVLELFHPSKTAVQTGGLDQLKSRLRRRTGAFSPEARDYGLRAPRGLALIGIPGTGKSLSARPVASGRKVPLLRLDVGAVFGRYIGQSEENLRQVLEIA